MARDKQAGGHNFDFDTDVCTKRGMIRKDYDDNGEPRCTGRPASGRELEKKEGLTIP
jgi:hypothetical protein